MATHQDLANLIWQIADLLRGPYRPPQYERVMLPMTVLRRFDCVLAPTKAKVLAEHAKRKGSKIEGDALDTKLNGAAGQRFHNHSPLDFEKLKGDPDNIEKHLVSYIKGFSANVRRIFDFFEFENEIERMREANILYLVISKFCDVDLHPKSVPNEEMGRIFENLIRRFNELANETAGDHFTPREVIRLMVNILFMHDDKLLATPGTVRKLLDPACGTGGMLAEAQNYLREHHAEARLYVYGQDYNKRAFATAASDMLMKEVSHNGGANNVRFGDSFTDDQFAGETFDYFLTNPPFGVDWVVTGSRLEAVRYKQSLDRYIQAKGYSIKSLVAFSGSVQDDKLRGVTYTEVGMNDGISEKELPEKFATQEYQVLLVAEKYQTGFDQPLLHTMFVDKRLAGIQAVQTLSRLNRIHPLKEDTFVLDFVNERDEIRDAFKAYYEGAEMGEEVDPARMYVIKGELDSSGMYLDEEVERFCAVYFKPKQRQSALDHQAMNAALDPAVSRFTVRQKDNEDEAELWRGKVQALLNLYAFLSQVIPYQDSDLERLYVFLRHLSAKLPRRKSGPAYQFDDEVRLEYYRLQKISEGSISLQDGEARRLDGPTEVGSGLVRQQPLPLSQLIDVVNERFGTDFNQADQLFFDQIVEAAMNDEGVRQAAAVNPGDKFELVFKSLLDTLFIERMDQNEEIFVRFMNDPAFQKIVTSWMASEAYRKLREVPSTSPIEEETVKP
jgi:N-6 DNA Methylase/HsdM N-terminal domain